MRELKYNMCHIISFLSLTCLFILSGCSNEMEMTERPSGSSPVLFNATKETVLIENEQTTTRAGIDDSNPAMDSLDDMVNSDKKILIYGTRYTDGGMPNWSDLFINGLTGSVEKKDSDYRINYSPLKYYDPDEDKRYDFKLFFPAPQNLASGMNDSSGVTILAPTTDRPLGLRVNLYRRPDLMKATVTNVSKTDQPLEPEFQHLLTSVVLKIIKAEEDSTLTPEELEQNIYINRLTVSGVIRGTYDIIKEEFEPPVKENPDSSLIDATSGASILVPGYTTHEDFLVPSAKEEPRRIREIFLFPVAPNASTNQEDLERYFFDIWLNERRYSFMLPMRNDTVWGGWKPGERYTYTLRVNEADIYIELDEDHISREPWNPEDKEDITIGVGAN